jgi:lysozyme
MKNVTLPDNEKLFMVPDGFDLIMKAEGFRSMAYLCPAGKPTIGFGHTGPDVTPQDVGKKTITRKQATSLLAQDVARFQVVVKQYVKVPVNPNQFSALVSFAYNLGPSKFKSSGVLKLLNEGLYYDASVHFSLYIYGDIHKPPLKGLILRRAAETELFRTPYKNQEEGDQQA